MGVSLTFEGDSLISINGLGDVASENQLQKAPFQDGSTYIDSVLQVRPIDIEFIIRAENYGEVAKKRSEVAAITNPKLGLGTLRYENEYSIKEIQALVENVPIFPDKNNRASKWQKGIVSFICPNPYWLDQQKTEQLVVWEGGLEFPLELPTFFAELSNNKSKILVNNGDVEAPIFITFNGPATAPIRVSNVTTGKFIQVNQNLQSGERLEINTSFGQKRVTKVLTDGTKQNAFYYIKIPESNFFGLDVGNNLIEYSTGADYESAGVTISWNDRFVGV